ncbi:hypothetical protein K6L05_00125 [Salinicoccus roseus]|uniref:hypothetical protein n=1 Tax=Salinicoccus roseus TaxID=45670 RepID=UPI001CA79B7B|nr:hypothetical protein [Salinicoccus roseus]MBY8908191.1 hypothetical protein [Salinicoccus roseus]
MKARAHNFGEKEFFITKEANFIRLEPSDIKEELLHIADRVIAPGDRITLIGKEGRKARTVKIKEGSFLEYRGVYSSADLVLAIFAVNGSSPENLYESFYYLEHKRLFILTNYGQSGTDIQANEINILEETQ